MEKTFKSKYNNKCYTQGLLTIHVNILSMYNGHTKKRPGPPGYWK